LNASNPFRMVRICIRMLRIPFEWFEFAFECFESFSKGSNLHSNASNPFRMVRICIRMLRIRFKWLEFAFECFESVSNGWNDPFARKRKYARKRCDVTSGVQPWSTFTMADYGE